MDQELTLEQKTKTLIDADKLNDLKSNFKDYNELLKPYVSGSSLPRFSQHVESPFKWLVKKRCYTDQLLKCNLDMKLEDYSNQRDCYSFEKFTSLLILVMENLLMKNDENSKKYRHQLKEFLHKMANDKTDRVYARIGHAFEHVYLATEAHFLLLQDGDLTEETKDVEFILPDISQMTPEAKAGIEAIKAKFYLSCCIDKKCALKHMMEAARLDPECAAWQYWTGKILRKLRRDNMGKIPEEEVDYFSSAVDKERDPKHLAFLAEAYLEKASCMYKMYSGDLDFFKSDICKEVDVLNQKSIELYKESWSLKQDSADLCRRIGKGLMSLPRHYADLSLAKEVLHRAVALSKNPVSFYILGTYYSRYEHDYEKATEFYQKAADHGVVSGFGELIRLKYINNPNYDPYKDLKVEKNAAENSMKRYKVYCDMCWYYLYFKNDLLKSLKYFLKVMENDEDSILLKNYKSRSLFVHRPINLYSLLVNEILVLKHQEITHDHCPNDIINWFLNKIETIHPELLEMTPNPQVMNAVHQKIERYIENIRATRKESHSNKIVKMQKRKFTTEEIKFMNSK